MHEGDKSAHKIWFKTPKRRGNMENLDVDGMILDET
jgi:hypothetical protein